MRPHQSPTQRNGTPATRGTSSDVNELNTSASPTPIKETAPFDALLPRFGGYSKTRYKKLVIHVASHVSAVSLFESEK